MVVVVVARSFVRRVQLCLMRWRFFVLVDGCLCCSLLFLLVARRLARCFICRCCFLLYGCWLLVCLLVLFMFVVVARSVVDVVAVVILFRLVVGMCCLFLLLALPLQ